MCYSILLLQFPEHRALLLSSITQSQYLYDNGKWVNCTLWKHFEVDLEFRPLAQVRNLFKDHLWECDSLSQLQSSWLRFTQGSHLLIYYCMQTSSKHLRDHDFSFIYWLCVKHLILFFLFVFVWYSVFLFGKEQLCVTVSATCMSLCKLSAFMWLMHQYNSTTWLIFYDRSSCKETPKRLHSMDPACYL